MIVLHLFGNLRLYALCETIRVFVRSPQVLAPILLRGAARVMDVPTIESIAFQHHILDVERGQPSVHVSARVQTQGLVDVLDQLVISKRLEKRPQRPRARARTRIVPAFSVEIVDDPESV